MLAQFSFTYRVLFIIEWLILALELFRASSPLHVGALWRHGFPALVRLSMLACSDDSAFLRWLAFPRWLAPAIKLSRAGSPFHAGLLRHLSFPTLARLSTLVGSGVSGS